MSKFDLNKLKKPKSKKILKNSGQDSKYTEEYKKTLKTARLLTLLTEEEMRKIKKLAEDLGVRPSPFIRTVLKKHKYI